MAEKNRQSFSLLARQLAVAAAKGTLERAAVRDPGSESAG